MNRTNFKKLVRAMEERGVRISSIDLNAVEEHPGFWNAILSAASANALVDDSEGQGIRMSEGGPCAGGSPEQVDKAVADFFEMLPGNRK